MNDSARRSDRELFDAVASGEAGGLAELAGRHARGVFDFALRGTLDEQQAAAVVEAAIRRVRAPGAQIPSQIDFRTWLYSIGLIDVLAVSNEARTARISTEDDRFVERTTDIDADLARWAWQAARGLRTRDYCVLDLTLRRGLTPEEVAEAASLTRSNLYGSIGRARGAFEETFAAMVLFERGRGACAALEEMVDSAPGNSLRPALRHQIIEHSEDCDACRRTLDSLPPAASVFVSLADVPIPDAVMRRILEGAGVPPTEATAPRNETPRPPGLTGAAAVAAGAALHREHETPSDAGTDDVSEDTPAESDIFEEDEEDEEPVGQALRPGDGRPAAEIGAAAGATSTRNRAALESRRETTGDRLTSVFAPGHPIILTYVLLGVLAVLAIYLGVAVADSLQSGGGDSGPVSLDSAAGSADGRSIGCGETLEINHGGGNVVSFNEAALDGYQMRTISYVPVSETAAFEDLEGTLENPFLISLSAPEQDPSPPRTEEFELHIEWERGDERATSICQLLVHVGP